MYTLNELPQSTQDEVMRTLCAYGKVSVVWKPNVGFVCQTFTVISNSDNGEVFIAEFNKDEVFTEAEQIVNYVNTFRDYPIAYSGKKDWAAIHTDWKSAALVGQDIVFS